LLNQANHSYDPPTARAHVIDFEKLLNGQLSLSLNSQVDRLRKTEYVPPKASIGGVTQRSRPAVWLPSVQERKRCATYASRLGEATLYFPKTLGSNSTPARRIRSIFYSSEYSSSITQGLNLKICNWLKIQSRAHLLAIKQESSMWEQNYEKTCADYWRNRCSGIVCFASPCGCSWQSFGDSGGGRFHCECASFSNGGTLECAKIDDWYSDDWSKRPRHQSLWRHPPFRLAVPVDQWRQTYTIKHPAAWIAFIWGTPDSYNTVSLYDKSGNLIGALNGGDIANAFGFTTGQYMQIISPRPVASVVAASSACCFEVGNQISKAAP
jgi:hypothetical protein